MSNPVKKRKISTKNQNYDSDNNTTIKIKGNQLLGNVEYENKLKNAWEKYDTFSDENSSIYHEPFRHGEIKGFIENTDFLDEFVDKFQTVFEFHDKASDLFQFKQSNDLKSFVDPHIYSIMEYLSTRVLQALKNITGFPLNDDIDLFLSEYRQTDFLLCHDDELDSRRIAFILYLSKDWTSEFGGNLDLFSSTEEKHPSVISKSITPEFNKFVFFEVSASSFHQVNEVTQPGVNRLALSGWFYGNPLSRPKISFPKDEGYNIHNFIVNRKDILKQFCSESYHSSEIYSDINEQLSEESQVLIPGFFQDEIYKSICSDIVEQDVSKSIFNQVGPPNIACYKETCKGPPSPTYCVNSESGISSIPKSLEGLDVFFHSAEFLDLMEKITEFPFTTCPVLRVTSSLRKYSKGSYSLLRSGGAKQTGEREKINSDDKESNDAEEEEEEPNLLDIIYFFASKWDDSWGGLTIYSAEDGEQLITIPPEGNCLAVIARNSSVNSYINYVNCLSKDEVYFSYNMTFAFDGKL